MKRGICSGPVIAGCIMILLTFTSVTASAQPPDGDVTTENNPVTVTGILSDADCPLSGEQQESIRGMISQFASKEELYEGLGDVLRDDQIGALEQKLHIFRYRNGDTIRNRNRISLIRNLALILVLEQNDLPLTEKQIRELHQSYVNNDIAQRERMKSLTPTQSGVVATYLRRSGDQNIFEVIEEQRD